MKKKCKTSIPKYLLKWRKKERKRYINMLAKQNEHEVYFYMVKLFNDKERFIKVGITIDLENRFKDIPYNHRIIAKGIFSVDKAWIIESNALSLLYSKKLAYNPKIAFGGKTECFKTASVLVLKKMLSKLDMYW